MCIGNLLGGLFGGSKPAPAVVRSSPLEDQRRADAEAAGRAAQARTVRRRAARASSLLATGGDGDDSAVMTAAPSATGKDTLGS